MIAFTKDVETFIHDRDKKIEIVFGVIPGKYGLSLKIFWTKNKIRFTRDLIDADTGKLFEGLYKDMSIYNFAYRQTGLKKFIWIRNRTDVRVPVDKEVQKYVLENYDMTLSELHDVMLKHYPERTL